VEAGEEVMDEFWLWFGLAILMGIAIVIAVKWRYKQ